MCGPMNMQLGRNKIMSPWKNKIQDEATHHIKVGILTTLRKNEPKNQILDVVT